MTSSLFSSRYSLIALAALLLLAVVLRWDVYPRTYFADELIPKAVVQHMQDSGTLDTNWEHADWRGDFAGGFYKLKQYNFSSYHTALHTFQSLCRGLGVDDAPALVMYRFFSLLCQLLAVLLVYAIARKLLNNQAAIFSATFLVIAPQAVVDAHYARPESFVILLVAVASWLSLKNCTEKKLSITALESIVWGVAFACKFSFLPMVGLAFVASCLVLKRSVVLLLWPVGILLGVAISAPYILSDVSGFLHGVALLRNQYAGVPIENGGVKSIFPSLYSILEYSLVFFTLPIFIIIFSTLFIGVSRKVKLFSGLVALISVLYWMIFSMQGVFFERNLSHLLPLWAVLFGVGASTLISKMSQGFARLGMSLCVALSLVWMLGLSWQIDQELFSGLARNKQMIAKEEVDLLKQYRADKMIPLNIMMGVNSLHGVDASVIVRVPELKVPEMALLTQALEVEEFKQVAYRELPLSFLPYNQLQINQLPVAYRYYQRTVEHP